MESRILELDPPRKLVFTWGKEGSDVSFTLETRGEKVLLTVVHRRLPTRGMMVGVSSGANICAAAKVAAQPEFIGKRIVTILPSLGERYLSTPLFDGLTG